MATGSTDEHLYRTIVENAGESIIIIQNRRIRFCNTKAVQLTGYTKTALCASSWLKLVHPDDRRLAMSECKDTGRRNDSTGTYPLRIHDREGKLKWIEVHHRQILWNQKDAVLAFIRNITETKRLESQFLQAQKMEAVGRLAGGVAHDFNNFLTVILGYTELLEQETLPSSVVTTNAQAIREAALKASALTQKLLAFSRKQHLEPKVLDLRGLLEGMRRILKRLVSERIKIVIKADNKVGSIHADANQLEQAILNLAVNAKDAMEKGGKLVIAAENVYFSDESLKPKPEMRPGSYVMLSISDTGIGMDKNTKAHLFEPFFTTKESGRGTGLGLATVYGIIKQSKGFIYVYSEPGKGTTFKLYFPQVDAKPTALPVHASPAYQLGGNETIMILEDEQQVLDIIENILKRKGYTVLTADNGNAAISQSQFAPGTIDLLITDLGIPDINGREVWDRLKTDHPDSRVLFISGYPEDFLPLQDIGEGKKIFLQKPFGSDALLCRVREILDPG